MTITAAKETLDDTARVLSETVDRAFQQLNGCRLTPAEGQRLRVRTSYLRELISSLELLIECRVAGEKDREVQRRAARETIERLGVRGDLDGVVRIGRLSPAESARLLETAYGE